ncbi:MAG: transcriptional regulator GcvA [Alphaproteobacteria bacterium]|nr:transcriptional regulator GcvA [Alphaproteobacteria bacterium]
MAGLPPLKSLQAFNAVARHLSFKRAAEEPNLTPTAVSHRIRTLEEHLGRKLFHRLTRSLKLTPAGGAYAPRIRHGFQALHDAEAALNELTVGGNLVVTATMSFATNWLGPRLHRFSDRHPEISLRLVATDEPLDFVQHGIDIAIRYGTGEYEDRFVAWILSDLAVPVCAPALLSVKGELSPEEILALPLIQYEWRGHKSGDPDWRQWFSQLGIASGKPAAPTVFSDEHMCLQAAIDGRGVALVGLLAAARDLEAGRLSIPHSGHLPSKRCYLTCPQDRADLPAYVAFREWLLEEADLFRDSRAGRLLDSAL